MNTTTAQGATPTYERPYRPRVGQRNYNLKLECPSCGAVAHMAAASIDRSGGLTCSRDGVSFVLAAKRPYSPRRTAEVATA